MAYGDGYGGGYADAAVHSGGWPFVTVEVAFTTDPAATPVWEDISAHVRGFSTNRGRQRELGKFTAGRATLVLANQDRRFDPTYTAGPYYPNVIPMRRLRIRATYLATTYDVFYGFVDQWGQTYQGPQEAVCNVDVTDGFKVLAGIELPSSVYEAEVRADTPRAWWRLGEPSGSTVAASFVGTYDGTYQGAPTLGTSGLVTRDPDTAMGVATAADGVYVEPTRAAGVTARPVTLEAIVKFAAAPALDMVVVAQVNPTGQRGILLQITSAGFVSLTTAAGVTAGAAATVATATSTVSVANGNPHRIAGTWDAAGAMKVYVDGADVTLGTPSNTAAFLDTDLSAHFVIIGPAGRATGFATGTIDEAAIYSTDLSAARLAAHSAAAATPWVGETSGARIGRILDAAGWPTADRLIDTGISTLQSADLGGSALAALQKVEDTEQGRLFMDTAGRVRFIARDSVLKSPYNTSQATFGDSGSELDNEDLTIEPGSDQTVVNEARVSRSGGNVQVVSDAASQTKYLRRTRTVDGLLHQSDAVSRDIAYWIVSHYKEVFTRIARMVIRPMIDEANLFPQALGREITDRVTVRKRPQNLGSAIEQAALVEGVNHNVTAMHWETTWNLSPAETQAYWIAGVAGASEAGQTTRAGF